MFERGLAGAFRTRSCPTEPQCRAAAAPVVRTRAQLLPRWCRRLVLPSIGHDDEGGDKYNATTALMTGTPNRRCEG